MFIDCLGNYLTKLYWHNIPYLAEQDQNNINELPTNRIKHYI